MKSGRSYGMHSRRRTGTDNASEENHVQFSQTPVLSKIAAMSDEEQADMLSTFSSAYRNSTPYFPPSAFPFPYDEEELSGPCTCEACSLEETVLQNQPSTRSESGSAAVSGGMSSSPSLPQLSHLAQRTNSSLSIQSTQSTGSTRGRSSSYCKHNPDRTTSFHRQYSTDKHALGAFPGSGGSLGGNIPTPQGGISSSSSRPRTRAKPKENLYVVSWELPVIIRRVPNNTIPTEDSVAKEGIEVEDPERATPLDEQTRREQEETEKSWAAFKEHLETSHDHLARTRSEGATPLGGLKKPEEDIGGITSMASLASMASNVPPETVGNVGSSASVPLANDLFFTPEQMKHLHAEGFADFEVHWHWEAEKARDKQCNLEFNTPDAATTSTSTSVSARGTETISPSSAADLYGSPQIPTPSDLVQPSSSPSITSTSTSTSAPAAPVVSEDDSTGKRSVTVGEWVVETRDFRDVVGNAKSLDSHRVFFVGCFPAAYAGTQLAPELEADLLSALHALDCYPVRVPLDLYLTFRDKLCRDTLWPIFHYNQAIPLRVVSGLVGDELAQYWHKTWSSLTGCMYLFSQTIASLVTSTMAPVTSQASVTSSLTSLVSSSSHAAPASHAPMARFLSPTIWIHGFTMFTLPLFTRALLPAARIGLFVHTPFPSSDLVRTLPFRDAFIRGSLEADILGFHTFDFARHFLACCQRLVDLEVSALSGGLMGVRLPTGRTVGVSNSHAGVQYAQLARLGASSAVHRAAAVIKAAHGNNTLLMSITDASPTRGAWHQIAAYRNYLQLLSRAGGSSERNLDADMEKEREKDREREREREREKEKEREREREQYAANQSDSEIKKEFVRIVETHTTHPAPTSVSTPTTDKTKTSSPFPSSLSSGPILAPSLISLARTTERHRCCGEVVATSGQQRGENIGEPTLSRTTSGMTGTIGSSDTATMSATISAAVGSSSSIEGEKGEKSKADLPPTCGTTLVVFLLPCQSVSDSDRKSRNRLIREIRRVQNEFGSSAIHLVELDQHDTRDKISPLNRQNSMNRLSPQTQAAYVFASHAIFVTSFWDGLNLVPLEASALQTCYSTAIPNPLTMLGGSSHTTMTALPAPTFADSITFPQALQSSQSSLRQSQTTGQSGLGISNTSTLSSPLYGTISSRDPRVQLSLLSLRWAAQLQTRQALYTHQQKELKKMGQIQSQNGLGNGNGVGVGVGLTASPVPASMVGGMSNLSTLSTAASNETVSSVNSILSAQTPATTVGNNNTNNGNHGVSSTNGTGVGTFASSVMEGMQGIQGAVSTSSLLLNNSLESTVQSLFGPASLASSSSSSSSVLGIPAETLQIPVSPRMCHPAESSEAMFHAMDTVRHGPAAVVVSEFLSCTRALSAIIRVNPWSREQVSGSMSQAASFPLTERIASLQARLKFTFYHQYRNWATTFINNITRSSGATASSAAAAHYLHLQTQFTAGMRGGMATAGTYKTLHAHGHGHGHSRSHPHPHHAFPVGVESVSLPPPTIPNSLHTNTLFYRSGTNALFPLEPPRELLQQYQQHTGSGMLAHTHAHLRAHLGHEHDHTLSSLQHLSPSRSHTSGGSVEDGVSTSQSLPVHVSPPVLPSATASSSTLPPFLRLHLQTICPTFRTSLQRFIVLDYDASIATAISNLAQRAQAHAHAHAHAQSQARARDQATHAHGHGHIHAQSQVEGEGEGENQFSDSVSASASHAYVAAQAQAKRAFLASIHVLSSDPCNLVFVTSCRSRKALSQIFDGVPEVGILAERGYFIRWPRRLIPLVHALRAAAGVAAVSTTTHAGNEISILSETNNNTNSTSGNTISTTSLPTDVVNPSSTKLSNIDEMLLLIFTPISTSSTSTSTTTPTYTTNETGYNHATESTAPLPAPIHTPSEWVWDCVASEDEHSRLETHRKIALKIAQGFATLTEGSSVESSRETILSWSYQNSDTTYGTMQAMTLIKNLESLVSQSLHVARMPNRSVEVQPRQVMLGIPIYLVSIVAREYFHYQTLHFTRQPSMAGLRPGRRQADTKDVLPPHFGIKESSTSNISAVPTTSLPGMVKVVGLPCAGDLLSEYERAKSTLFHSHSNDIKEGTATVGDFLEDLEQSELGTVIAAAQSLARLIVEEQGEFDTTTPACVYDSLDLSPEANFIAAIPLLARVVNLETSTIRTVISKCVSKHQAELKQEESKAQTKTKDNDDHIDDAVGSTQNVNISPVLDTCCEKLSSALERLRKLDSMESLPETKPFVLWMGDERVDETSLRIICTIFSNENYFSLTQCPMLPVEEEEKNEITPANNKSDAGMDTSTGVASDANTLLDEKKNRKCTTPSVLSQAHRVTEGFEHGDSSSTAINMISWLYSRPGLGLETPETTKQSYLSSSGSMSKPTNLGLGLLERFTKSFDFSLPVRADFLSLMGQNMFFASCAPQRQSALSAAFGLLQPRMLYLKPTRSQQETLTLLSNLARVSLYDRSYWSAAKLSLSTISFQKSVKPKKKRKSVVFVAEENDSITKQDSESGDTHDEEILQKKSTSTKSSQSPSQNELNDDSEEEEDGRNALFPLIDKYKKGVEACPYRGCGFVLLVRAFVMRSTYLRILTILQTRVVNTNQDSNHAQKKESHGAMGKVEEHPTDADGNGKSDSNETLSHKAYL